ncbi:MAG: hypothetical protein OXC29_12860 [Rhodococcus sp.]|nr:hypothetical protein [Rhodococcus sp. (in: high G+C Gram-positive bacteria)]
MDAEAPTREQYVKGGAFWLIVLLAAGYVAPRFVGMLLMLFSVLVFVLAVVGLAWPSVMRLPNRLASVWVFTLSVGLFIGGGMLMAPPNGESTASDEPVMAPARTIPRTVPRPAPAPRDPCSLTAADFSRMSQAEADRAWNACVEQQGGSAAVDVAAGISPESESEIVRQMLDAEAMTACQDVIQEAARDLYRQGGLYRWTQTALTARLSRRESKGDATTYGGNALQVMNQNGEWAWAFYECDWSNRTREIVDVRVR